MKKKGYKKFGAKVAAAGVAAGVIAVSITGFTLASKLSKGNRPEAEHPYDDTYLSEDIAIDNTLTQEPTIDMEEGYEDFTPETILPELQKPIIPDDKVEETLGVEFVEVLAKLTAKSKEYVASVTGNTPNLTITGLTSMTSNSLNGDVAILGQVKVGENYNHFIASMNNVDTTLAIYQLNDGEVSEEEFINALDEILVNENTTFKLQLKQYIKLSNAEDVINNMLTNRLEAIKDDTTAVDEINQLNTLLADTSKLKLNVLLNNHQTMDGSHNYSFTIMVNTGKYTYSSDLSVTSSRVLTTTALKHAIEEYLDSNKDYAVDTTASSTVNQAIYIIDDKSFNVEADNTLNK